MKLRPLSLGLAIGIICAVSILVISYYPWLTGKIFSGNEYGNSLRFVIADLYPWYDQGRGLFGLLIGMIFGFIDGFLFGAATAWLYNLCSKGR